MKSIIERKVTFENNSDMEVKVIIPPTAELNFSTKLSSQGASPLTPVDSVVVSGVSRKVVKKTVKAKTTIKTDTKTKSKPKVCKEATPIRRPGR